MAKTLDNEEADCPAVDSPDPGGGGGGGADPAATYWVTSASSGLSAEKVVGTSTGVVYNNAGTPQVIANGSNDLVFTMVAGVPAWAAAASSISLSNSTPQNVGTASAGVATAASRSDHVHALPAVVVGATVAYPVSITYDNQGRIIDTVEGGSGGVAFENPNGTPTIPRSIVAFSSAFSSTDNVDTTDFDLATAGVALSKLANLAALSVLGRSAGTSGVMAAITASTDQVLRESGGTLGFGTLATGSYANNSVTLAKIAQMAGLSVPGVAGSATADLAAITAVSDGHVLRRASSSSLGFGTLLASSFAANTVAGSVLSGFTVGTIPVGVTGGGLGDTGTLTFASNIFTATASAGTVLATANSDSTHSTAVKTLTIANTGSQTWMQFTFGGTAGAAWRGDNSGNLAYHALGAHVFYNLLSSPVEIFRINSTSVIVGSGSAKKLVIGVGTPGNGTKVFELGDTSAPSTSPSEGFTLYSVAGQSSVRNKDGLIGKLFPEYSTTLTKTLASATSATWDGWSVDTSTLTLSGVTNVTTATGLNMARFQKPTITSGSSLTVTTAATVAISGAPTAGGSTTITNAYALWIQAGMTVLGGPLRLSHEVTVTAAATTNLGSTSFTRVQGATSIDYFTKTSLASGNIIYVYFDSALTINHNSGSPGGTAAAIMMRSGANTSVAAGALLAFMYSALSDKFHEVTGYGITAGASAHSGLTGLTSGDDHTQYALLAGRSGGQTLIGGTAASNNLVLTSTSHGTLGEVRVTDNFALFGAGSFGGGTKVMSIINASLAPGSAPTGGIIHWSEGGVAKVVGTDGIPIIL